MTETRAAYEAATLEAMHTGDYAALTAYARTVADVDGEPEPPDLEYTPITAPLPAVVDAAEVAELRARIAELEAWIAAVPLDAIHDVVNMYDKLESRQIIREWQKAYWVEVRP